MKLLIEKRKDLSDFLILVPPLPEQKKIAEILSNIDDAIEETDRIIEKTKVLKKGLMQEFLTKGIGHKKIANVLDFFDSEIDNEERKKQELEFLRKAQMQVLLTGKVRVKVG